LYYQYTLKKLYDITRELCLGEFYHDQIHGQGVMQFINDDNYIGCWFTGQRTGKGDLIYSNGDRYSTTCTHNSLPHYKT